MRKQKDGLSFLFFNRQLNIMIKCGSILEILKRAPADVSPAVVDFHRAVRAWFADGWVWARDDVKTVQARIRSCAGEIRAGRWPAWCSDLRPVLRSGSPGSFFARFLRQPYSYGAALIFVALLSGTLCFVQGPPIADALYAGKGPGAAGSYQTAQQPDRGPDPWSSDVRAQSLAVAPQNPVAAVIDKAPTSAKLQVTADVVNVRSGPGSDQSQIGQVQSGDILQASAKSNNGWYLIDFGGSTGWVSGQYVQAYQPEVRLAAQAKPYRVASVVGQETPIASRGSSGDVISTARRYLGTPYVYGANGPYSFDCSGFVHYVYARCGVDLPRVAADQAAAGKRVSNPAPGDLVFFSDRSSGYITHVGLYIGNNSFIHACFSGVTITTLDDPWYRDHYSMACRVR